MMHDYEYIAHYGTKGMEWGKRLFQNKDGSLTPLGRVHYGVGEARKKAVATVKKAPKAAGDAVKKIPSKAKQTMQDLASQRRQHNIATTKRRAQVKQERFEAKQARREAKAAAMARKLIEKESKTTLKELQNAFDDARTRAVKRKVDRLIEKKNAKYERELLKEQEKQLKKDIKNAKRDARRANKEAVDAAAEAQKKYSISKIKSLSDDEIDARIARLKKEGELKGLEASRNMSAGTRKLLDSLSAVGVDTAKAMAQNVGTSLTNKLIRELGLSPETAADQKKNYQDKLEALKARDALEEYVSSSSSKQRAEKAKRDAEEEALNRESRLAGYRKKIAEARKAEEPQKESAEDASKRAAAARLERQELERRAQNYRGNADKPKMTIAEIAKRMNLTEQEVKDLLYV